MKNNNWEKEIREKLDSYSTVDLDGLWERVESATESRKIAFIPWKKALVATAAIAASAAIVIWSWRDRDSIAHQMDDIIADNGVAVEEAESSKEYNTYTIENTSDSDDEGIIKKAQRIRKAVAVDNPVFAVAEEPQPTILYDTDEAIECETMPKTRKEEKRSDMTTGTYVWQDFEASAEKRNKRRITFLAYGGSAISGEPSASQTLQMKSSSICDATSLHNYNGYSSGNVFEQPATTYRWNIGTSASMRVELDLNDRFGLSSGLSWTSLEGTDSYQVFKPTLHYLGVPVWLSCRLFGQEALSVKAVGGPRIDFLVKGSPDIETGPVQLSVHGGLQAEYMFSRWFGFSAGAGADLYVKTSGSPSPFESLSPVANVNLGLLFKL